MLFVACLRSPVLYFATQQSVEENPEKKGPFLSQYSHPFSFKQVFLWCKAKKILPKQHSLSEMQSAAALQSEHNSERLQLPAHRTELGPVPALGHGWQSNGTAQILSALAAGSVQLLGRLPTDGRAAAVSPQGHREGLPPPACCIYAIIKDPSKGLPLEKLTQKLLY